MNFSSRSKKTAAIALVALALAVLAGGSAAYRMLYAANFHPARPVRIYIDRETDFDTLCRMLADSAGCASTASFRTVAAWLRYPAHMKTGCYRIDPGTGNLRLVRDLRSGHQEAVRVTFNNVRTTEELAARLDEELMLSADELLRYLRDPAWCDSLGFTTATIPALFIPNTYEVYWNTSAPRFLDRMKREYDRFWSEERRQKAAGAGLTPTEVAILASIVEEETAATDEYPLVAGLYINRLRRGIPLQADPTVKFAVGDPGLRRILYAHLEVDSPYNTYKHAGLPPGPLRVPSIRALDAVLNYARHSYIYMCAKEDLSGRHNFARTLAEHNRNAARYRAALDRRGIR